MIRETRRGKLSKGILLQQDNARVHTCEIAMDAIERNGYELLPHPAYSPDLAPSDCFLFPNLKNLKKDIRGRHFRSNEEVVAVVEEWVRDKDPGFFSSGLMALEHRWSKCIILEGNCINIGQLAMYFLACFPFQIQVPNYSTVLNFWRKAYFCIASHVLTFNILWVNDTIRVQFCP